MNTDQIPGADGTIGPGPGQYGQPHVYARDVTSGAGNCVCGHPLTDQRHTETAPGVPHPHVIAHEHADLTDRLAAIPRFESDPSDPDTYAFVDEADTKAQLERAHRIRNILHDAMVVRAGRLWSDAHDDAARAAVVSMLATYIEYAVGRPAGLTDPARAALGAAKSLIRMETDEMNGDKTCCDLDGEILDLWWESLTADRQREIADAHTGLGPMMLLANEYTMPRKPRRYRVNVDVSACYPDQLHGTGLRIVIIGCNVRWPKRPAAVLLCAECGHTQCLERPPRGWPAPRSKLHRAWIARIGYQQRTLIGSSTVHRGVAVMHAWPIGDAT